MPGIEERPLTRKGEVIGTRYVVRVYDTARAKYTSATFATRPEAERFVRDCADRGKAWALDEYRRDKDASDELTLDQWAEIHFKALTAPSADTVARYRGIYKAAWSPALRVHAADHHRPHRRRPGAQRS